MASCFNGSLNKIIVMKIKDCVEYLDCVSSLLKFPQSLETSQGGSSLVRLHATISNFTNILVVPLIGLFGILGNSLNLLVLTRKQLARCSSIERSYNSGLVALAAADLVICFFYFLKSTMNFNSLMGPKDSTVPAYFSAYVQPIINVSIFASTWFTTAVAISRYVAICHPLQTRSFVNLRVVRTCLVVILVCAMLVNLPRFLHYRVVTSQCSDLFKHEAAGAGGSSNLSSSSAAAVEQQSLFNASCESNSLRDASQFYEINKYFIDSCSCTYSHKHTYLFFDDPTFKSTYNSMSTLVTTLIPLAIMIFCNVCFVKALRHSFAIRSVFRSRSGCSSSYGNSCSAYCPTDMSTVTRVKEGPMEDEREGNRVVVVKGSFSRKSGGFTSQRKMLEIQESFAKSSALSSDEILTKNLPGHENQGQETIESKATDSSHGNNFGKKPLLESGKPKVVLFRLSKTDSQPSTGASFKEIKDGNRIRSRPRSPKQTADDHYITPTLIAIIIFFVLLVTPSELLGIVQNYVITEKDRPSFVGLSLAVDITNCFHLLNFSINAVLYSIINVKFRRTVKKLLCYFNCCRWSRRCGRKRSVAGTDGDSENTGINKMQMTSAVGN